MGTLFLQVEDHLSELTMKYEELNCKRINDFNERQEMKLLSKKKAVFIVLFAIYIIILFYLTLFSATFKSHHAVNLLPFKSIVFQIKQGGNIFLVNLAGNIAAFIPMGVLPGILAPKFRKLNYIATLSFAVSIFIETMQYIFALRVTDIDDVILNVLGGIVGYLFLIVIKVRRECAR